MRPLVFSTLSNAFQTIQKKMSTSQLIAVSFILMIVVGAILLTLPIATADGKGASLFDAAFTATSAVCVTGLTVVDTYAYWSGFGKGVILLLVQLGGLGLITLTMLFLVIGGQKITLRDRLTIQTSLNQTGFSGMVRLIRFIMFGTLLVEGIAAFILTIRFWLEPDINFSTALGWGVFHSISAFCNAGFDIMGRARLSEYVGDPVINIVIMLLVVLGGLGFSVWLDTIDTFKKTHKQKRFSLMRLFQSLTLHSKVCYSTTAFLLVFGAAFIFVTEYSNAVTLGSLNLLNKIWASLFHSVSIRTAGFFTMPANQISDAGKLITSVLMMIGGSPGGTAGGLRTTTVFIIAACVYSVIRGRSEVQAYGRTITTDIAMRALALLAMFMTIAITATMILNYSDPELQFLDCLMEISSACGTTGLHTGITADLSPTGRSVVMACMYIGRIGPITATLIIGERLSKKGNTLKMPEENIMIG